MRRFHWLPRRRRARGRRAVSAAYPGGTPNFQTDVAPYCAGCHSSRSAAALAGAGERAAKEVAERKHLAVVLSGQKGYASLSETDRHALAEQIRALDEASTVTLAAPAQPAARPELRRARRRDRRRRARGGRRRSSTAITAGTRGPAASAGWHVIAPPKITGPDGQPQTEWLARRPEGFDRNLSFVNIAKIAVGFGDEELGQGRASCSRCARPNVPACIPSRPSICTAPRSRRVLGYTTNPVGYKEPRGGFTGGSGRVLFTPVQRSRCSEPGRGAEVACGGHLFLLGDLCAAPAYLSRRNSPARSFAQ